MSFGYNASPRPAIGNFCARVFRVEGRHPRHYAFTYALNLCRAVRPPLYSQHINLLVIFVGERRTEVMKLEMANFQASSRKFGG
jgi:hypothetical protein